jgi:hypothetical protein
VGRIRAADTAAVSFISLAPAGRKWFFTALLAKRTGRIRFREWRWMERVSSTALQGATAMLGARRGRGRAAVWSSRLLPNQDGAPSLRAEKFLTVEIRRFHSLRLVGRVNE